MKHPDDKRFEPKWPDGLKQGEVYQLDCDDKGRDGHCWMKVWLAPDGDVHLMMQDWENAPNGEPTPLPSIRSRTYMGGGRNLRTHQALLWLAQAIRLDALERSNV